jgi:hypothetical protein
MLTAIFLTGLYAKVFYARKHAQVNSAKSFARANLVANFHVV